MFLYLWYSCVGKDHSQIPVNFFLLNQERIKSALWFNPRIVLTFNIDNLFFFWLQNNVENSRISHPWPGHLAQVCKTCQGFDWCKLDPRYIVWLILTLKCSEHVFRISYCCLHKNNYLNWLLTWKTVVLYVTGLRQYQTTSASVANKPMVMCLH